MSRAPQEGRNRTLSADDAALWAEIAAGVRPLAKERPSRSAPKPRAPESCIAGAKAATPNEAVVRKLPPMPLAPTSRERLNRSAERLNRSAERNLKRGVVAIGDRLDLHGLDREQAHRAVSRFLSRLADEGERVALVITGKGGRGAGIGGVLRAEFPRWLSESPLARLVLAWRPAAPRHGGDGAFYVLLRRKGARP